MPKLPPSVFKFFLSTDAENVLSLPSGDMLCATGTAAIGYAGMIVLKEQGVEVNRGVYVSAS